MKETNNIQPEGLGKSQVSVKATNADLLPTYEQALKQREREYKMFIENNRKELISMGYNPETGEITPKP